MKKVSLTAIYNALTAIDFDPAILAEIQKELTKGDAQKAKNADTYAEIYTAVVEGLSYADAPVTCAELYESIKGNLPSGVTKAKVQYGLSHLWDDTIVKIEGKPNTYRLA